MTALPPGYRLVSEPGEIDLVATHAYLTRSYWAEGIPFGTVAQAVRHSLCAAIRCGDEQVAFARLVTDYATFAYLADVYVIEEHRGKGLSHRLLDHFQAHPDVQGLRRWALFTRDAQALYSSHGWKQYPYPDRMMTIDNPDVYR